MRITVIGSGFGGLAAAVRLATMGHEVTLLEKRDKLGGRAYVYERDGFTFDGGPTVITAPWLIEELFDEAGRNPADYLTMVPVDPFYKIFFEDGSTFHYNADRGSMIREIEKFNPGDVDGYLRFLHRTEDIFRTGFGLIAFTVSKLGVSATIMSESLSTERSRSVSDGSASRISSSSPRRPAMISLAIRKSVSDTVTSPIVCPAGIERTFASTLSPASTENTTTRRSAPTTSRRGTRWYMLVSKAASSRASAPMARTSSRVQV